MGYKKLELKTYREYLSKLQNDLDLSDNSEQKLYDFVEDKYNSIEDDDKALFKSFNGILNHTSFNIEEKMFGAMLLLLCDLKTQDERRKVEGKNFKKKFEPEEEDDEEEEYED